MLGLTRAFDVTSLPAPVAATPVTGQVPGQAELDASVTVFAHGRFTAAPARYFQAAPDANWQMFVKLLAEQRPLQGKAKRVRYGWEEPGIDLIEVFDTGDDQGVVVAMKDGLIGYYPVTFDHTPRDYLDPRRPS